MHSRKPFWLTVSTTVAVLCPTVMLAQPPHINAPARQRRTTNYPVGNVCGIYLFDFQPQIEFEFPLDTSPEHFSETKAKLKRALEQSPHDFSIYTARIQADTDFRNAQIAALNPRLRTLTGEEKFKLGVAESYNYIDQLQVIRDPKHPLTMEVLLAGRRIAALLNEAWSQTHNPIAGLACSQAWLESRQIAKAEQIRNQVFKMIAGPAAYKACKRAESHHWAYKPPAVAEMPLQRIRPLRDMLENWYVRAGAGSPVTYKEPRTGVTGVHWVADAKEVAYVKAWLESARNVESRAVEKIAEKQLRTIMERQRASKVDQK